MGTIRIALANLRPAASADESVARARAAIIEAAAGEAALICFPECYVPGYRMADSPLPPPSARFLEGAWADVATTARDVGVAVILGTERLVEGKPRITTLVVARNGEVLGFQDKVQLDPSEERTYAPGDDRHLFRIDDATFGIAICHEGWRYPESVRWAAQRGAQIVFHPHFHPPEPGGFRPTTFADPRNTFHEKAMLCRAAENTCWFVSVNCAMEGSPTTSAVVAPSGEVKVWQEYGVEGVRVVEIELGKATREMAARLKA
jgi:predicted amidohydrolase